MNSKRKTFQILNIELNRPEIDLEYKTYVGDEFIKYAKAYDNKLNLILPTKFRSVVSEISKKEIKRLYFKYLDFKNIYVSVYKKNNPFSRSDSGNIAKQELRRDSSLSTEQDFDYSSYNAIKTISGLKDEDLEQDFDLMEEYESNISYKHPSEEKDDSNQVGSKERKNSKNKGKISPKKNENMLTESKKEMTNILSSIISVDTSSQSTKINLDSPSKQEQQDEIADEKASEIDEKQMIEMLKTYIGDKVNQENSIEQKIKEEAEYKKILSSIPNYSFMTSKYVEYPHTFFN